jgi:hypothetical protein
MRSSLKIANGFVWEIDPAHPVLPSINTKVPGRKGSRLSRKRGCGTD